MRANQHTIEQITAELLKRGVSKKAIETLLNWYK